MNINHMQHHMRANITALALSMRTSMVSSYDDQLFDQQSIWLTCKSMSLHWEGSMESTGFARTIARKQRAQWHVTRRHKQSKHSTRAYVPLAEQCRRAKPNVTYADSGATPRARSSCRSTCYSHCTPTSLTANLCRYVGACKTHIDTLCHMLNI